MEIVAGLHWVDGIWDTKVYVWSERDHVVLIDAATPGRSGAIWRHLESLGHAPQAVAEVWLTHGDIDHMGSAAALKSSSGARLVAHVADVPLVEGRAARQMGAVPFRSELQRMTHWSILHLFRYRPAKVDQAVEDGDTLQGWKVLHVPGHTAGSVCYYHPDRRIAIVGDAITHRRHRLAAPPRSLSSDASQARASVRRIAELDIAVCCFGHGPPLVKNARQQILALAESLN